MISFKNQITYSVISSYNYSETRDKLKLSVTPMRNALTKALGLTDKNGAVFGIFTFGTFKVFATPQYSPSIQGMFALTCRARIYPEGEGGCKIKVLVSRPPVMPILLPALCIFGLFGLIVALVSWNALPLMGTAFCGIFSIIIILTYLACRKSEVEELALIDKWVERLSLELGDFTSTKQGSLGRLIGP